MSWLWLLWACSGSTAVDPLAPLPPDLDQALAHCGRIASDELAITCRVEVAARAAGQERDDLAERACGEIGPAQWQEECHFRAGEEHGRRGDLYPALSHCSQAGQYRRFCLTHLGWHFPPDSELSPTQGEAIASAYQEHLELAGAAMDGAPESFVASTGRVLRARFWHGLYFGSGSADPSAARAAPEGSLAEAHTGFAAEAVRLLAPRDQPVPDDLVDQVLAVWDGTRPPPSGPALEPQHRHGRYHPPMTTQVEQDLPTVPMYGGGRRFVSEDPRADLVVATLEALYLRPETPAEVFLPYVQHDDPVVRWTAARLVRVTPSGTLDHVAVLTELASSEDPGLAAHGHDGLRGREWTKFVGGPRPQR